MKPTVLNAGQNFHIKGGSDRYQFDLSRLLERQGHRVIPLAADHPENTPTRWSRYFPRPVDFQHPGPNDLIRFIYSRSAAKAVERLLRHNPVDIAHLHIYYGQLTASILRPLKQHGVPVVQTLHEYKLVCPVYTMISRGQICEACEGHRFWHVVQRRCNRGSLARSCLSAAESYVSRWLGALDQVDHFITVSDFQKNKITALGVPAAKVTTVHNFVPLDPCEPEGAEGGYFLYFGRIERIKGIFTLLEAAERLPDVRLLIVGDGSARAEVEAQVQRRGLRHVELLGFKQGRDLRQLIRGCLCAVLPSQWYETFGLTILEAFVQGRPVIASGIGGMTEVIDDGEDGFHVPPGDVDALAGCLAWMAKHPREAVEMGRRGRHKARTRFGAERHYRNLMEVYEKLL